MMRNREDIAMTDEELDQFLADAKAWLEEQAELPCEKQHFLRNIEALVEEIRQRRSKFRKAPCPERTASDRD